MLATCKINQHSFEIELVSSKIADSWIDLYQGVSMSCSSAVDLADRDAAWSILERHRDLWPKIGMDCLAKADPVKLLDQSYLGDMHKQMVIMQKNYKMSTSLLDSKTKGDWSRLHEHLHSIENTLVVSCWIFDGSGTARHTHDYERRMNNKWNWEPQFTAEEWRDSTTFSHSHLEIVFTELGRYPWECFIMSPDNWEQEGSLAGNLLPTIKVKPRRLTKSIPVNYSEWCKKNQIPVVGERIPLANFKSNDFLSEIIKPNPVLTIELK